MAVASVAVLEDAQGATSWRWTLEVDGSHTCRGPGQHFTDTHRGKVEFDMPAEAGAVQGKSGEYLYKAVGQSAGSPWQVSGPGRLTFQGKVTPGELRFTPQVYLPDGRPFFRPLRTHTIAIYDGASLSVEPMSAPPTLCKGPLRWTIRGPPRERYHLLIDDRVLIADKHGAWSGITYMTGLTVQVLTEIDLTIEANKVIETSGSRRLGRLTPFAVPELAWQVTPIRGRFRDGHTYPSVTPLRAGGVSATMLGSTSAKVSTGSVFAGGAWSRRIVPKEAKRISPDIQQFGSPQNFSDSMGREVFLPSEWQFGRRQNTTRTVRDDFNHLQVLQVTQKTTAMGHAPGASSGALYRPKHFKGDAEP